MSLVYLYSNNGMTFRAADSSFTPAPGEVSFSSIPTVAQLQAAFAGYNAAATAQTAQATFATKTAAGITITAGGANNAPTATFALDAQTQSDLAGIAATCAFTGAFPGGGTTFQYPGINGSPQSFPSLAAFKTFYIAYNTLVLGLKQQLAIVQAGGTPNWPSNSVALS